MMPQLGVAVDHILIDLASRTNEAGTGQWVHIIPSGTFQGRDGRGPYKLNSPTLVINASRERAGRVAMPIDYDHAIDLAAPRGIAAPAAGWIKGLQARVDGIWGLVDWTPRAAEQLAQREYRYLSPVITHDGTHNITSILRASLTNHPNFGQLTALASMETTEMDMLPELRKLLGLPDDASIDEILAKVKELTTTRQAAMPDLSKFVPIGDFERVVSKVNELNQGISLHAATDHVGAQILAGRMPPFLKEWGISLCSVNKPAFDKFIERTGPVIHAKLFGPSGTSAAFPTNRGSGELSQDEIAIASNLGLTQNAFLKSKTERGTAQEINR